MDRPLRVALAEDHPRLAESLAEKLRLFPGRVEFLFHAPNGRALLERLAEHAGVDVVLMDIEMPVLDGIQATAEVAARHPHVKVLMLTVFDDERRIAQAIQAGAAGYLLKDETPERLMESIEAVARGEGALSALVAARALALLREPRRDPRDGAAEDFGLSAREQEVLRQLAAGLDHQRIAANLFIAPATVRKHLENLYRKLEVDNKVRAVEKARRAGLLS